MDKCDFSYKIGTRILFKCFECGLCCENLSFLDRFKISYSTKKFIFYRRCYFLTKNNKCSIYNKRPLFCKKWKCGVVYEC